MVRESLRPRVLLKRFSGALLLALSLVTGCGGLPGGSGEETVGTGVVVEEEVAHSALEQAGIRAGDLLLSWRRLSAAPAKAEGERGEIGSVFDWEWLKVEQAPRGAVELTGERHGEPLVVTVERGRWEALVRPAMSQAVLEAYLRGREQIEAQEPERGVEAWRQAAELVQGKEGWHLRCWLSVRAGQVWARARAWEKAQAAYREALDQARDPSAQGVIWDAIGRAFEEQNKMEKAEEAYRAALEIRETHRAASLGVAASKNHLSGVAWSRGDLEAVEAYSQAALAVEEELAPESLVLAETLRHLGNAARERGDLKAAEAHCRRALSIAEQQARDSLVMAAPLLTLGIIALDRSDLETAEAHLRHALNIYEKWAPNSVALSNSLTNLGFVAWDRGDLVSAEAYLQRVLEIRTKAAPGTLAHADSLNNLGLLARERGDFKLSQTYHQHAFEITKEVAPDSLALAQNFNNLGAVARERGDLELAQEYYQRALAIKEELVPDSLTLANTFIGLGIVAGDRGEIENNQIYHERALEIQRRHVPDSIALAMNLHNLSHITLERGDVAMAETYLEQSLKTFNELAPNNLHVACILSNLGDVRYLRGDHEAAEVYYRTGLARSEKLAPNSLYVATHSTNLGIAELNRGHFDTAERYLRRALEIREKLVPNSTQHAESLHRLGELFRRRERHRQAADYLGSAIDALEGQIGRLGGSHDLRASFRAQYEEIYRDASEVLLELGRREEAFHVLERFRARSLLAMLAERDLAFSVDIPEALEQKRRRLAVRYDRTFAQMADLGPERDPGKLASLRNELAAIQQERDALVARIREGFPKLAALQYPEPLTLQQARAALDPGVILLSYSVGKARSDLFVLSREQGLAVTRLAVNEEKLRAQVRLLRQRIRDARPDAPRYSHRLASLQRTAQNLYATLIEPAADRIEKGERLLILADGPLHALPWGALMRPAGPGEDSAGSWQYLVEWKPLHTAVSATMWAELKRSRREPGGEVPPIMLAAFGDPLFPQPLAKADPEIIADVRVRSAARRGFDFAPLPATRMEVEGITALYGAGARAYLGAEATEERAKAPDPGIRYLHFATHGTLDERFPLDSAVVLTLPETFHPERDNGLLQAWEIFEELRIDADLVVLSSCESALGPELGGEGLIGLTRAFHYAGARAVLASLWQVQDATTAELMIRFYRHLQTGQSKDEALRAAQLELLRGPIEVSGGKGEPTPVDASAPYYWAAFQVSGDGR